MTKVIHVHLFCGRRNYYFGSLAAINDVLTAKEVGMTMGSLLHAGLEDEGCVLTKKAMIRQSHLIRKKQEC